MSARRIILNVIATYGRSIISFALGLLTTRWVLAALGQSDFGLFGVVGSVVFFATFLNEIFSQAISRFYAYAIGECEATNGRVDTVKDWFNTSLSIHLLLPILLVAVGYPIGEYAVRHWLVIPSDRVWACCWVFRLAVVTAVIHMLAVPYQAMYLAYQNIVELSFFTIVRVFALFGAAFALCYVQGDRLIAHAVLVMMVNLGITIVQVLRSRMLFPACRISRRKMFNVRLLKQVFVFFSARFFQGLGWGLRGNGSAILVNLFFGEMGNASFTVAGTLSAQAASFSSGLVNAFAPAVTTAAGAKKADEMMSLAFRSCRFGSLLVLFFGIPLIVEMDNWLHIWLKNPPENCYGLCVCMVVTFLLDYLTIGHHLALSANGKIFSWQMWEAALLALTLPVGWLFVSSGYGLVSVGFAYVMTFGLTIGVRLIFTRKLLGMRAYEWFVRVLFPILFLVCLTLPVAKLLSNIFPANIFRVGLTAIGSAVVLMCTAWFFLFDMAEKQFVCKLIKNFVSRRESYAK